LESFDERTYRAEVVELILRGAFDNGPGWKISSRCGNDGGHEPEVRALPSRNNEFATGSSQPIRVLDEFLMKTVGRDG
jgi:hypothetical protein